MVGAGISRGNRAVVKNDNDVLGGQWHLHHSFDERNRLSRSLNSPGPRLTTSADDADSQFRRQFRPGRDGLNGCDSRRQYPADGTRVPVECSYGGDKGRVGIGDPRLEEDRVYEGG